MSSQYTTYYTKLVRVKGVKACAQQNMFISGRSRISHRGVVHPLGGGGMDLRRGHFLVKMYAKMKELGPMGGVHPAHPPDPPMFINFPVREGSKIFQFGK